MESSFDRFVIEAGGNRVTSLLQGPLTFENADYAFPSSRIVGELKEINTDFADNEAFRDKHFNLMLKHVSERRMSARMVLGADPLSSDFIADFVRLFRPALARIVKKANSQIKSTKAHLAWADAAGVLFLINDGFASLEPHFVQAIVSDILTSSYSSVDCFVYMTVNTYVELPGNDFANLLWVPTYSATAPNKLVSFIDELGRQWFTFLDMLIGPADWGTTTADRSILLGSKAIKRVKDPSAKDT